MKHDVSESQTREIFSMEMTLEWHVHLVDLEWSRWFKASKQTMHPGKEKDRLSKWIRTY